MRYPPTININVKHNPDTRIPQIGDKVILLEGAYKLLPGDIAAKLARLQYVTVNDVMPLPIGKDGNYEWMYEVYIEETDYPIGFYYTFYKK